MKEYNVDIWKPFIYKSSIQKSDRFNLPVMRNNASSKLDEFYLNSNNKRVTVSSSPNFFYANKQILVEEMLELVEYRKDLDFIYSTHDLENILRFMQETYTTLPDNFIVQLAINNMAYGSKYIDKLFTLDVLKKELLFDDWKDGLYDSIEDVLPDYLMGGRLQRIVVYCKSSASYEKLALLNELARTWGVELEIKNIGLVFMKDSKEFQLNAVQSILQAQKSGLCVLNNIGSETR